MTTKVAKKTKKAPVQKIVVRAMPIAYIRAGEKLMTEKLEQAQADKK